MRKTKTEALKTREHLMLAALETFYLKGVSRASLNEIAQNAGVTRGALYWHFKNKEDLFDALFHRLCDEARMHLENDLNNESADMRESMHASLLNMFQRMENDPVHYKFCNILFLKCEHTEQNQTITRIIHKYQTMWHELLSAVLAQCIKQKSLPENLDIPAAVLYLKASIDGLLYQWLIHPEHIDLKTTGPRFAETIFSALEHCTALHKTSAAA